MEAVSSIRLKPKMRKGFLRSSFFKIGQIVEGEVINNDPKNKIVYVDLGKATGIILGREYIEARRDLIKMKPKDKIKAKIIELSGEDGYIELSLKEALRDIEEEDVKKAFKEGTIIEAKVIGANRGGLILQYKSFTGFLPTSQMSKEHFPRAKSDKEILAQLQKRIGEKFQVKISNYSNRQRKLIFTEKF